LTESERSGERLLEAARRVRVSESINRISEFFDRMTGFSEVTGRGMNCFFASAFLQSMDFFPILLCAPCVLCG
jgi:hypothetical protein